MLHKFYPNNADRCWCCQEEGGMLFHFWSCPKIEHFCKEVQEIAQTLTDWVPDDKDFFLVSTIPARIYKKSIIRHLLNVAKSCIPVNWKKPQPPTISCWLHKVEEINKMEDLILTVQHKCEKYSKLWRLWNMFVLSEEGAALFGLSFLDRCFLRTTFLVMNHHHLQSPFFPFLYPPPSFSSLF